MVNSAMGDSPGTQRLYRREGRRFDYTMRLSIWTLVSSCDAAWGASLAPIRRFHTAWAGPRPLLLIHPGCDFS